MPVTDHLDALRLHLSHERERLRKAKTGREREFYSVRVKQCEKEIAGELKFLGINEEPLPEMTDDELMAELNNVVDEIILEELDKD